MNEQSPGATPPEVVVERQRQVKRYRRGQPVPAQPTITLRAIHPGTDAEDRTRTPPSFRSLRTWVTMLSAICVLLGVAVTTGYIVTRSSDPAFGTPARPTFLRPSAGTVGPPVFSPTRHSTDQTTSRPPRSTVTSPP